MASVTSSENTLLFSTGYFDVAFETGAVLCRIALWECFETSFLFQPRDSQ